MRHHAKKLHNNVLRHLNIRDEERGVKAVRVRPSSPHTPTDSHIHMAACQSDSQSSGFAMPKLIKEQESDFML